MLPTNDTAQELLTLTEAAACVRLSRRSLEREIADGKFPSPIKLRSLSFVTLDDVGNYLGKKIAERNRRDAS